MTPKPIPYENSDAMLLLAEQLRDQRATCEYLAALALDHLADGNTEAALMALRSLAGGKASSHAAH